MIKKRKRSSRQLLNLSSITEFGLQGYNDYEMVYYLVQPTNLSVMSEENITAKIFALTNVLKGLAEVEIMCLNSKDNFDQNKLFLKQKYEQEQNETVKMLLEKDLIHLDKIQIQTATARLFMIIIRIKTEEQKEKYTLLGRIDKLLKMQNFSVHRADKKALKSMLGVYFEQNVTTDHFEDIDGERWLKDDQ